MNDKVLFRRLLPGVSVDAYWQAVKNGTREAVLAPPDELPVAAYGLVREIEAALGAAPAPIDAAELRERLALWEREWREAEPCGPDGEALAQAAPLLPMSPLERRQYRPRRPTQKSAGKAQPQPRKRGAQGRTSPLLR